MSTSRLCLHCRHWHPADQGCKPEDLNEAHCSLTPEQLAGADAEETQQLARYIARRNLPPEDLG